MLTNVLKSLVSRAEIYDPENGEPRHPLLARRPEKNVLLIVVTGDKGLAGAFNTNILKAAMRFIATKADKNLELETIGRKGRDFLRRRYRTADPRTAESQESPQTTIVGEQIGIFNKVDYALASELAEHVIERYAKEEIDAVYLLYNEFKSVIAQRLVVEQILPIEQIGVPEVRMAEAMTTEERDRAIEAAKGADVRLRPADTRDIDAAAAKFATAPVDYIYEQSPEELFRSLLPKYVAIQVFRSLQESVAAEHAARMTAMDAATNNATDMIDSLTLAMNRARQAKITKEIIEIVSGAAAQ
jgi:F-type H+-transporting ATPase subunit gamma